MKSDFEREVEGSRYLWNRFRGAVMPLGLTFFSLFYDPKVVKGLGVSLGSLELLDRLLTESLVFDFLDNLDTREVVDLLVRSLAD